NQRELAHLAQASNFATRAPKGHANAAPAEAHEDWSERLKRALGVRLASIAPSVWGERTAGARETRRGATDLSPLQGTRAGQTALALAQQDKSAFTRADVVKNLGRVLPRTGTAPNTAASLLESIADRALAGEFEQVICLEAPEAVPAPES